MCICRCRFVRHADILIYNGTATIPYHHLLTKGDPTRRDETKRDETKVGTTINQPTHKAANQPTHNQPTNSQSCQPTDKLTKQPANQSTLCICHHHDTRNNQVADKRSGHSIAVDMQAHLTDSVAESVSLHSHSYFSACPCFYFSSISFLFTLLLPCLVLSTLINAILIFRINKRHCCMQE
jgi:hypothetical protein